VSEAGVLLCVLLPAVAAGLGLLTGGLSRSWAREWGVLGALGALLAAVAEVVGVVRSGPVDTVGFLGDVDTGVVRIGLDLRADALSAVVAVAVGLVAFCVQVYSTAYLRGDGTPDAPTRYSAYAASVSMFTAAMMLVVHADDLVLLLIGWEVMGLASYLLVGHHSERPAARAAAVKAFLVTRVGDLGVLVAVLVLLGGARTTAIGDLNHLALTGELNGTTATAAALLLLAGAAGKSAQFPLHTWLPDAMEGPTPISALIHAATMVAAGVFLVARFLPVFLAAHGALEVAAVIAAVTMLGAALAALAQDDFKRLLAWSTISQVAYMLGGVAVAGPQIGAGPGIFHLLAHASFKALLFLVAGCVAHVLGTNAMSAMGGLRRSRPGLALLLALGLASLAGVPPLGGFWSKESVLTAAEHAATSGSWAGWLVLGSGLATALVTGIYAGRAWTLVAGGERRGAPDGQEHHLPGAMVWPLVVLAVPTVGLGLLMLAPSVVPGLEVAPVTAVTGGLLSLAGIGWALSAPRLGTHDVADALPDGLRSWLFAGYRLDDVQDALVVRPVRALARMVGGGDRDVVDAYVRATAVLARWGGLALRRADGGLMTGYLAWLVVGAVAAGFVGVMLS
jgi:NADH-quinone oxidoreductase subunit L